jgi:hypothetical protein
MTSSEAPSIWTVYDHPRDYPAKFVARRTAIHAGAACPTNDMFVADNIHELRLLLPPGLYRLPRHPKDDPVILEVWL